MSCIVDFWSQEIGVHKLPLSTSELDRLGSCKKIVLKTPSDIVPLGEYPIVWYIPNKKGKSGYNVPDSPHYSVRTRVEDFVNGNHVNGDYANRIEQLKCKITSMGNGLNKNVVIRVAHDTTYEKSIIIDGVKRSLALYYFKVQNPVTLNNLLSSKHQIYILKYSSSIAHKIFPSDFSKLVAE